MSSPGAVNPITPTVNVRKLTKALKSPHADPTLELWDRYSLLEPNSVPAGFANRTLAQLMVSSSPRPTKDGAGLQSGETLRRTASCGLNWPKRRKIERPKASSQISGGTQRELEAASKSSLVSALLDTVTHTMHTRTPGEATDQPMTSPSLKRGRASPRKCRSPEKALNGGGSPTGISEYGDDDLDDDAFMELEATITSTDTPLACIDGALQCEPSLFQEKDCSHEVLGHTSGSIFEKSSEAEGQPRRDEVDPEDEFGGDFDEDIDFEAVELAATQSIQQQARNSSSFVRDDPTSQRRSLKRQVEQPKSQDHPAVFSDKCFRRRISRPT